LRLGKARGVEIQGFRERATGGGLQIAGLQERGFRQIGFR
jgi:hypothetical protein